MLNYYSLNQLLLMAEYCFESNNCLDVLYIKDKFLSKPGLLEIIEKENTGPYSMIKWDNPNWIHLYDGREFIAGTITKEKFDNLNKENLDIIIGQSFIFNKAFRTYAEIS